MIKSMTGYGKSQKETSTYSVQVEIKTLNSKYFDAIVKLPRALSSKEIEVRNVLTKTLQRGKVLAVVDFSSRADTSSASLIDKELLKSYYRSYQEAAKELQVDTPDLFRIAALAPDVIQGGNLESVSDDTWRDVMQSIREALSKCDEFRQQEGLALSKDMEESIGNIHAALEEIKDCIPQRDEYVRQRLSHQMSDQMVKELIDNNRFEQEMIYYLEKLDINEEIVRLTNHLTYFVDILRQPDSQGKKLGFVAQEIGREINTIGSKANDATIQRHVVNMKENLEKIKEQALNVL